MAGVVSHMLGDFAGSVAPTAYVTSVQRGSITIANGSSSNTATISAVGTLAWVQFNGFTCSSATSQSAIIAPRVTLSNTTTVTANRNSADAGTIIVYFEVIDATSLLVESVEQSTTTFTGTSNTPTLSGTYDLTRTAIFYLGDTSTDTSAVPARRCNVKMASATTITATRNSSATGTVGWVVVQFKAAAIQSIQQFATSYATTNAVDTQAITAVVMANTMVAWGGENTGGSGYYYTTLTSTTNINLTRVQVSTAARIPVITVIEFVSGVVASAQRMTIDLTSAASNTAAITSVDTTKTLLNFGGYETTSTDTVDKMYQGITLTNATTVTGTVNTNSATVKKISAEAITFN